MSLPTSMDGRIQFLKDKLYEYLADQGYVIAEDSLDLNLHQNMVCRFHNTWRYNGLTMDNFMWYIRQTEIIELDYSNNSDGSDSDTTISPDRLQTYQVLCTKCKEQVATFASIR